MNPSDVHTVCIVNRWFTGDFAVVNAASTSVGGSTTDYQQMGTSCFFDVALTLLVVPVANYMKMKSQQVLVGSVLRPTNPSYNI